MGIVLAGGFNEDGERLRERCGVGGIETAKDTGEHLAPVRGDLVEETPALVSERELKLASILLAVAAV